jgi:hypothetical protein
MPDGRDDGFLLMSWADFSTEFLTVDDAIRQ